MRSDSDDYQDLDLHDAGRDRSIPVRLWRPRGAVRAWVLFSVGFGGDRDGYAYLGRAWATQGVATAVVEHVGSNLRILRSLPGPTRELRNMQVAARVGDPEELAARPRDMLFVQRHLAGLYGHLPLGLAGHSFGSYTVLAAMGLPTVAKLARPEPWPEGTASCLLISPQPPGRLFSERALGMVPVPVLVLTGTRDGLLDGSGDYTARLAVYDHLPVSQRNLAVLEGVEHMAFAGIGLGLAPTLRTIEGLTGHWWQSTLLETAEPAPIRAHRLAVAAGQTSGEAVFR